MIPHYKESPLVQNAINDMEKYLNEKHEKVQETKQTVEVKQEVPEAPVKKESGSVEPNRAQKKKCDWFCKFCYPCIIQPIHKNHKH